VLILGGIAAAKSLVLLHDHENRGIRTRIQYASLNMWVPCGCSVSSGYHGKVLQDAATEDVTFGACDRESTAEIALCYSLSCHIITESSRQQRTLGP
jgi:hypothetical protein